MTENTMTLVDVSPPGSGEPPEELPPLTAAEQDAIRELVRRARASGTALTGPGGLLKQLTKMVVEAALDEEMSEHLGYDKHAPEGRNLGNSRNGKRTKTVVTDNAGPVEIVVPRDRDGTFEPVIVRKRQRRLSDLDAVVLSLSAKGLTTGEISAHFADVYGADVSKDTVTRITDRVIEEMAAWWARPLEPVYAAVFIDATWSRSVTGRSVTGPCTRPSGWVWPGTRTSWACGPATVTGECEVLVRGADRSEGPRRQGRVLRGLRRPEGATRQRQRRVPAGHRPDVINRH